MEDQNLSLSPLDQIMGRFYTVRLLYFPLSNPDHAHIASNLKSSLQRTFEALPILSGTVQPAPHSRQSGSLCVGAPWNGIDKVFRVSDLTSSDLDYEDLRRAHFPMTISAKHNLFSVLTSRSNAFGVKNPVMMAQVNFVRGGMILVQFLHHSFMDGLGGVMVMELWATFCRGQNGAEMISGGMMDRKALMLGDETGRMKDFPEYVNGLETLEGVKRLQDSDAGRTSVLSRGYRSVTNIVHPLAIFSKVALTRILSSAKGSGDTLSMPQLFKKVDSEIFFFSRSKLLALKFAVSASMASAVPGSADSKIPSYISTNDALSALLFACVTEARKPSNTRDTQQAIPFCLTVSGRRLLPSTLSPQYVGNMTLFCHLDVPLSSMTPDTSCLAMIAYRIRTHLTELDESYVRRLIGALHKLDDIGKVMPACRASKKWTFIITPWTGQGDYSMDWGREMGGQCERVRLPKVSWPAFDGVNVILPELKVENGVGDGEEAGLEVMVGLERGAMQRLRGMEEWTRWAEWRCS